MFAVIALLVVHAKSGEGSRLGAELGADISLLHSIVPCEIEGGILRKKDHTRVRQFVMNEPG